MIEWKPVNGFEDYYLVSTSGDVYSIRRKRAMSTFVSCGYAQVELNVGGVATKHLVHRLVAETFIPNPENLPQVNHADGNKLNNNVDKLEWCTRSENMKHALKYGLAQTMGSTHPTSKLTEQDVKYIKSFYKKRDSEHGLSALGRRFGVDHKTIWFIVNGVTWRTVK